MKRKRNQACLKKTKENNEVAQSSSLPQFLQGLQCYVHPACFGSVRRKIFENHIKQYGGQLVPTLPKVSDAALHVVFEESVDEEKMKRLVDTSQFPNSIFLKCTWLVECVKSKVKARTEPHLIKSVNPAETWTLEEGVKEVGRTQNKDLDKTFIEEPTKNQTRNSNRTEEEETLRIPSKTSELPPQRTVCSSKANVGHEAPDTVSTLDSSVRFTAQSGNPLESQSFAPPTREHRITEYQKEPLSRTVGDSQVNKLVICTNDTESDDQDIPKSLIKPFPKNMQVNDVCYVIYLFFQ